MRCCDCLFRKNCKYKQNDVTSFERCLLMSARIKHGRCFSCAGINQRWERRNDAHELFSVTCLDCGSHATIEIESNAENMP